jgi:hypothetical protein
LVLDTILLHTGEESRGLEGILELLRGMWDTTLEASASLALIGIGDSGQEISSGLTSRALETKVDEVLAGKVGGAKVDAATLIEKNDLVKEVVNVLGLQNSKKRGR